MLKIVESQELSKAIYYEDSNFLDKPDLIPEQLINHNVFPYRKVPLDGETNTYIAVDITDYKPSSNPRFKRATVYIYVLVHESLFHTDYGDLRYDFILSELDKLFNNSKGIGDFKLTFKTIRPVTVNERYTGNYIAYDLLEFN